MMKEIVPEPGMQFYIKCVPWWPIRLMIKFLYPPSSTIMVSRSNRDDQPIQITMGEMFNEEIVSGKRPLRFMWQVTITTKGASQLAEDIRSLADQLEHFEERV